MAPVHVGITHAISAEVAAVFLRVCGKRRSIAFCPCLLQAHRRYSRAFLTRGKYLLTCAAAAIKMLPGLSYCCGTCACNLKGCQLTLLAQRQHQSVRIGTSHWRGTDIVTMVLGLTVVLQQTSEIIPGMRLPLLPW